MQLTIGVVSKSRKKDESRVAIHPDHFGWIPQDIRKQLFFEKGYGLPFGVSDEEIAQQMGGVVTRDQIFSQFDVVLAPKPELKDFEQMHDGGILWGWAHVVQQQDLAQIAIDRHLTLMTWESMNTWTQTGDWLSHIFYKNNEIAGYAGIQHALQLTGKDGNYGPASKATVINFGSVSRGATYALQGRGYNDITVYTLRPPHQVANQVLGPQYRQITLSDSGEIFVVDPNGQTRPFIEELAQSDLIINGILQDTDNPLMFVKENEIKRLKKGSLIVDVSCDEGMGFPFAKPTSFENPMFTVEGISYYAVDHIPSYMWNSASWEISRALIPFLSVVVAGRESWKSDPVVQSSIEIQDGAIVNPKILSFQNRNSEYPHQQS